MPRCRTLMLAAFPAIALASCASVPVDPPAPTIQLVEAPRVIPEAAKRPCPAPVVIPDADLSAQAVTSLWAQDRNSLIVCEGRRAAAVAE